MLFSFNNPNYPLLILIKAHDFVGAKYLLTEYLCLNPKYDSEGSWELKEIIGESAPNIYIMKIES